MWLMPTELARQTREPNCCFCGVRVGLRVAHILSMVISIGMTTVVSLLDEDIFVNGMLTFFLSGSLIGLSITFCRNPDLVRKGLYAYYTLMLIGLILLVVIWIQIGEKELDRIADLKKSNPNLSDTDIDLMKKQYRQSIQATVVYQTVSPTIFFLAILNRTNAYRNWLLDKKGINLGHSMAEMNLIAFADDENEDQKEMSETDATDIDDEK